MPTRIRIVPTANSIGSQRNREVSRLRRTVRRQSRQLNKLQQLLNRQNALLARLTGGRVSMPHTGVHGFPGMAPAGFMSPHQVAPGYGGSVGAIYGSLPYSAALQPEPRQGLLASLGRVFGF